MRIFSYLYQKVLRWSQHRHARYYLAAVSFTESSIFPIPPDVMLISMTLAEPKKAWQFAFITTVSSVLGGIFGYLIGLYAFHLVMPYFEYMGYANNIDVVQQWFNQWGFWVVFLAGFSPIPYKVFTIAAGAMHMAILPFIIASAIGRGLRFYLVSSLMYWGGARVNAILRRSIDWIGWSVVVLAIIAYIIYMLMH